MLLKVAARNVLVNNLRTCKVADFGLSRIQKSKSGGNDGDHYYRSENNVFPVRWSSPEAMETKKYTSASDVWSFAVVVAEIFLDGAVPYKQWKTHEVVYHVLAGERMERPVPIFINLWLVPPAFEPADDEIADCSPV